MLPFEDWQHRVLLHRFHALRATRRIDHLATQGIDVVPIRQDLEQLLAEPGL